MAGVFLQQVIHEYTGLRSFSYEPMKVSKKYRTVVLPRIVAAWGSGLERLRLGKIDVKVVNAIARNCKELRLLKLTCWNGPYLLNSI